MPAGCVGETGDGRVEDSNASDVVVGMRVTESAGVAVGKGVTVGGGRGVDVAVGRAAVGAGVVVGRTGEGVVALQPARVITSAVTALITRDR